MNGKIHILGVPGSLRKKSYNRSILESAVRLVPDTAELDVFTELGKIPPFNQDLEASPPPAVSRLKEKIREADAILFATPEYNYSVPGVLKNAIDWASRPYGQSAWEGKPVAVMSASTGMLGGARAQYHLRQTFVFLNMHPVNRPEVIIPDVQNKIDANGNLSDTHTMEKIHSLLESLVHWTVELRTGREDAREIEEKEQYEKAYGRMAV